jgi:hypothetical protein
VKPTASVPAATLASRRVSKLQLPAARQNMPSQSEWLISGMLVKPVGRQTWS